MVQGNELMRILNIAAFAVSGYASTQGRQCKPFNPLLGETYEADYPDKGLKFFSEKVTGFFFNFDLWELIKFLGKNSNTRSHKIIVSSLPIHFSLKNVGEGGNFY